MRHTYITTDNIQKVWEYLSQTGNNNVSIAILDMNVECTHEDLPEKCI